MSPPSLAAVDPRPTRCHCVSCEGRPPTADPLFLRPVRPVLLLWFRRLVAACCRCWGRGCVQWMWWCSPGRLSCSAWSPCLFGGRTVLMRLFLFALSFRPLRSLFLPFRSLCGRLLVSSVAMVGVIASFRLRIVRLGRCLLVSVAWLALSLL